MCWRAEGPKHEHKNAQMFRLRKAGVGLRIYISGRRESAGSPSRPGFSVDPREGKVQSGYVWGRRSVLGPHLAQGVAGPGTGLDREGATTGPRPHGETVTPGGQTEGPRELHVLLPQNKAFLFFRPEKATQAACCGWGRGEGGGSAGQAAGSAGRPRRQLETPCAARQRSGREPGASTRCGPSLWGPPEGG